MQLRDGYVQLVAAGVFQRQKLRFTFSQIHTDESEITAYAVLFMYDRIARFDLAQIAQSGIGNRAGFAGITFTPAVQVSGIELALGYKGYSFSRVYEAVVQRPYTEHEGFCACAKLRIVIAYVRIEPVLLQMIGNQFTPAQTFGKEQRSPSSGGFEFSNKGRKFLRRIHDATIDLERGQRNAETLHFDFIGFRRLVFRRNLNAWIGFQRAKECLRGEKQLCGFQQRPITIAPQKLIAR